MGKQIEKIAVDMKEGNLAEHLERYKQKAIELGATKAKIVKVGEIFVDDRVTIKCRIPRCFGYGVCAHCPPNAMKPEELKKILEKYYWAVFFIKEVAPEIIVRNKATIKERIDVYLQVFKIVNEIESMAFYDGHYLAFGLAAGSCKHSLCAQHESCQALEGKRCRFSLQSRPSMEAVGIDVYKMAASAGWDIYPIGSNAKPDQITKGTLAGIVIVQ
jgi:predicted metal-binding protein